VGNLNEFEPVIWLGKAYSALQSITFSAQYLFSIWILSAARFSASRKVCWPATKSACLSDRRRERKTHTQRRARAADIGSARALVPRRTNISVANSNFPNN